MKKCLFALLLIFVGSGGIGATVAHATIGASCSMNDISNCSATLGETCDLTQGQCVSSLSSVSATSVTQPASQPAILGSSCDPSNASSCGSNETCDSTQNPPVCVTNLSNSAGPSPAQSSAPNPPASNGTAGFTALAPIPGLTNISPTATIDSATLASFFNNLYKYLIGLAAMLAVIMITWGGLEISTKDSVSKQSDGKERIYNAIFGLVLVLSPVLVFSIINPAILNLSLNLPALDTAPVPVQSSVLTPCTSNCNTGAQSSSIGMTQGTGMGLFACNGSDCSAASAQCANLTTVGVLYTSQIVCVTTGTGNIDPGGATTLTGPNKDAAACKSGESLSANCIESAQVPMQ